MASIRDLDPERDAQGVVALTREVWPTAVVSPDAWRHRVETIPERAEYRAWVAEEHGVVVGNAYAGRNFFTQDSDSGFCGMAVSERCRRRGIGSAFATLVLEHSSRIGAHDLTAQFVENAPGVVFAQANGFREARAETESILDPRTVSERPPPVDLRAVAEVDPRLVYDVDIGATADMPSLEPIDDIPYDEWEGHVLGHPLFTDKGSFVAMEDGIAVAVSLLVVDHASGRAANMFTGTLAAYRGRGLGLAVKLASIEWAARNGVTQMVTTNDETNAPMLAINRRLGYVPSGRRVEYLREGTASSPAPPAPAT
jgi:GNAT superfamily N-acetyltransferase